MAEPHKVRIKIGEAEFEAEGSEESVKLQFDAFLAALSTQRAAPPPAKPSVKQTPPEILGDDEDEGANGNTTDKTLSERAFVVGKDGGLSLKYLPKGDNRDGDAVLLLLYGYFSLRAEESILGTHLIKAARVSGLALDRIDRALVKHKALILTGGARKGVRYSLNNQGKLKAQELLKAMLT